MAADIPTARPIRPQADIERIYRRLDSQRFGMFPNGGELPPFAEYLTTNVAADALAWVLHLEAGAPFGLSAAEIAAPNELQEPAVNGVDLIALERRRQVQAEGWTAEHDDEQISWELSTAAACYAVAGIDLTVVDNEAGEDAWPWEPEADKREQHPRLHRLVIAGALIAAEIDRLLRAGEPLVSALPAK